VNSEVLRTYVTLLEKLSFTKTAQFYNVSQSTVTKRIDALETEVGVQLIVRSKKSVVPTAKGTLFLEYAKSILETEGSALKAVNGGRVCYECLKVGCVTTLLLLNVSNMIISFQQENPEISVDVREGSSHTMLSLLYDNEVDVCFSFFPFRDNNYVCDKCFEDEIILVSHPGKNLFSDGITVEQLRQIPLIKDEFTYISDPKWFEYIYSGAGQKAVHMAIGSYTLPFLLGGIGYGFAARTQAQPFLDSGDLVEIHILDRPELKYSSYVIYKIVETGSKRLFIRHIKELLENQ
jgi:DNA-binding transcriptional LysR family regulator